MPLYRPEPAQAEGRGQKRRRDDEFPQLSPRDAVVAAIIRVGDVSEAEAAVSSERERAVDHTQRKLSRELNYFSDVIQEVLLDCAVELSTKTAVYATLTGLLNADNNDFVAGIVQRASEDFDRSLAAADTDRCRMLLRFFAALAGANVLHATSVLAAFQSIIDAASTFVESGGDARSWQPYADFLVSSVLMALPWGGSELAEGTPDQIALLFSAAEAYINARPQKLQHGLRPFLHAAEEPDLPAQSDSGGASFLSVVWEAVSELRGNKNWRNAAISRPTWLQFEARLAEGQPHELPPLTIPPTPPGTPAHATPAEAAAAVLEAFPPRGGIALLPQEYVRGNRTALEQLILQQYILDTLHYFDGDRVACARKLALGLPVKEGLEALLAETLFSQLLCLPHPPLKPLAYSSIMIDVCKLLSKFPRPMSACVRECFKRMPALDPELRARLAAWLALHLSNFEFMWPWERWRTVLDGPVYDPRRRFVGAALARLVRLSYSDKIRGIVPQSMHSLLPAAADASPAPALANGTDAEMPDAENGAAATHAPVDEDDAAAVAATVDQIRLKPTSDALLAWLQQAGQEQLQLQSPEGRLRVLVKALLAVGAKSLTHLTTFIARYRMALQAVLQEHPAEAKAQEALVGLTVAASSDSPQRTGHAVQRFLRTGLVSGADVVRWAFSTPSLLTLQDTAANDLAWELVDLAVSQTVAQMQVQRSSLKAGQARLQAAQITAAQADEHAERLDVEAEEAQAKQAAAAESLAAVQAALGPVAVAVQETGAVLQELLLLVFQEGLRVLTEGAASITEAGEDEALREERRAWHADAQARVRGLARRWHMPLAPLVPRLDREVFSEEAAGPDTRADMLAVLHL